MLIVGSRMREREIRGLAKILAIAKPSAKFSAYLAIGKYSIPFSCPLEREKLRFMLFLSYINSNTLILEKL